MPPVAPARVEPSRSWRRDPLIIAVIGLVIILITAVIVVAFLVTPVSPWNFNRSLEDDSPNVNTLNLNFETNIGRVSITTLKVADNNVGIYVQINGSRGIFSGTGDPVRITFDNRTVGSVLTVNSHVTVENAFSSRANVNVQIYVDPALNLNLNVTSVTGQVSFNADKATTIQSLSLQATTGEVEAHLQENVDVTGDISLRTNTGTVNYRMSETNIVGNCTLALQSTTGAVNMEIIQTQTLEGNLRVNAETTTGSINVGLKIDLGVGARIVSQAAAFGNLNRDVKNFSGDGEDLRSNNYPAATNIEISNRINGFGDVNIQAAYQSAVIPTVMI